MTNATNPDWINILDVYVDLTQVVGISFEDEEVHSIVRTFENTRTGRSRICFALATGSVVKSTWTEHGYKVKEGLEKHLKDKLDLVSISY